VGPTTYQQALDTRALEDAIREGYIVAQGWTSLAPESWRGWCEDGLCPCVIVRKPGARAHVELDLSPAGWGLSKSGAARVAAELAGRRMNADGDTTGLRTAGVSLRRAENFAVALLRLLADPTSTDAS
jgi:hypothetical protein